MGEFMNERAGSAMNPAFRKPVDPASWWVLVDTTLLLSLRCVWSTRPGLTNVQVPMKNQEWVTVDELLHTCSKVEKFISGVEQACKVFDNE